MQTAASSACTFRVMAAWPELLADAANGKFDALISESIDRISRLTADGTQIEKELKQNDVVLVCADEPLIQNATTILTRRVKQATSEWYVLNLLELSHKGMVESVFQGWHSGGREPYGFLLEEHPHPNPHKAREGKKRHRLVVDPVRGPIIVLIFDWYCNEGIGYGEICDRLTPITNAFPRRSARVASGAASPRAGRRRPCAGSCATRSTRASTSGTATTSAVAGRRSARASSGSGATSRRTLRS